MNAEVLEETMTKKRVGYWRGIHGKRISSAVDFPDCPDVKDFIDPSWNEAEKNKVSDYLKNGKEKESWKGSSVCRICGKRGNGSSCLTDGEWVWPEGLAHYIDDHNVKPPQVFVDYVLSK